MHSELIFIIHVVINDVIYCISYIFIPILLLSAARFFRFSFKLSCHARQRLYYIMYNSRRQNMNMLITRCAVILLLLIQCQCYCTKKIIYKQTPLLRTYLVVDVTN